MAATDRPADAAATAALYGDALTRGVYDRLARLARAILIAGGCVVVDATCMRRWQREAIAAAARDAGAPLVWVEFDLPERELVARVAARFAAGTDASDASVEIVRRQLAAREPIGDDELGRRVARARVAAETEPVAVAAAVAAVVNAFRECSEP
jgi:predicted kinase